MDLRPLRLESVQINQGGHRKAKEKWVDISYSLDSSNQRLTTINIKNIINAAEENSSVSFRTTVPTRFVLV